MARSDAFQQYAQGEKEKADPLAEIARAKAQYTTDQPRTTLGDYSFKAPRHPAHQAVRHIPFPYPQPRAVPADGGSGAGDAGAAKPARKRGKVDVLDIFPSEAPPLHPDQAEHERRAEENWGRGSGRDFNDQPIDGIGGSASGRPVLRPGPRPGGLSGSAAVPIPEPEPEPVSVGSPYL
jgi:hypothetical protein